MQFSSAPLTYAQLEALITPQRGAPEAVPDVLFDTQLYTSAVTLGMNFFTNQQNDLTLSNLNGNGQLPSGNWFRIAWAGADIIQDAFLAAGVAEGAIDDYQKLLLIGRPMVNLLVNGKSYLNIPLSFLHTSGGAVGGGWGTLTAPANITYANNSLPDGGFPVDGAIVIPPLVGFSATITYAAAQALAAGNPRIRLWFAGTRYRPVV